MIKLKQVSLRNFKSFGNTPAIFRLDSTGSTLILGDNQDVGERGNSRNGVGKSTFMAGVVYALYGKDIEKMKPDEMVNFKNQKNMVVELEFDLKGVAYRIVRGRKPNILELYADGQSTTRDSMKNTDQLILDVVGIDYDVFLSVFFLNTFRPTFMSLGSAGQRDFVEKVLGLDVLASRAEALKLMKKEYAVDLKLASKDAETDVRILESHNELVQNAKHDVDEFEEERVHKIQKFTSELDAYIGIDFDRLIARANEIEPSPFQQLLSDVRGEQRVAESKLEMEIERLETLKRGNAVYHRWEGMHELAVEELQKSINEYPAKEDIELRNNILKQIEAIDSKVIGYQDRQRIISTIDLPDIRAKQDKLQSEYEHLIEGKCPYCSQSHTDQDRVSSIEEEFVELEDRSEKLTTQLQEITDALVTAFESHDTLKKQLPDIPRECSLEQLADLHRQLEREKAQKNQNELHDLSSVESLIDEISNTVFDLNLKIAQLDTKDKEHAKSQQHIIEELDDVIGCHAPWEIEKKQSQKAQIETFIREWERQENPHKANLDRLSSKQVPDVDEALNRVEEIESNIKHCDWMIKLLTDPKSFIRRNILDQYLPFLNKKIFDYCRLLDGAHIAEIQNDMTVRIEYIGEVSYYSMSRGERFRLDIATTMAFRDLMKLMGKAVNTLFVDEVLDNSLDPHGTNKVFQFITGISDNTLLISHRSEFETLVDNVMVITKKNGFTVVED